MEDEDGTSWAFLNSPIQDLQAMGWMLPFCRVTGKAKSRAHHSVVLGSRYEAVQHLPQGPVSLLRDHQLQGRFETETVWLLLDWHYASPLQGVACVLPGTSSTLKHTPVRSWCTSIWEHIRQSTWLPQTDNLEITQVIGLWGELCLQLTIMWNKSYKTQQMRWWS